MIEEIEEKIPMSKKYEYLDSSDDELEGQVLNQINIKKSYVGYIFNKFEWHNITFKDFTINLALAVHNFADRVFRNSEIDKQYKKHKLQIFKDGHKKLLLDIDLTFFNSVVEINRKVLDKSIISEDNQLIFNKFQENKKVEKIDFSILAQNPLILNQELGSADLLSFSKLVTRNNKNTIKSYVLENIISNTTNVSYKLPVFNLKTLSEYHVIKSNGNAHSLIPELGTYDSILSKIPKKFEDRQIFINNIFKLIKNQEPNNDLHNNDMEHLDERIVHLLFITEMQRNNAVLFTAPIFLKLLNNGEKIEFPMSAGDAVSHCRGIFKEYKDELPNHSSIDYDNNNISTKMKTTDFLSKEGKLIVQFVKGIKVKKEGQFNFDKFFTKLEQVEFIKKSIITDASKISLKQIHDIASYIKIQNPFVFTTEVNQEIKIFDEVCMTITHQFLEASPSISIDQGKTKLLKNLESLKNKYHMLNDTIITLSDNIEKLYELFNIICNKLQTTEVIFNNITQITPEETEGCIINIFQELSINMKDWYDISLNNEFPLLGELVEI